MSQPSAGCPWQPTEGTLLPYNCLLPCGLNPSPFARSIRSLYSSLHGNNLVNSPIYTLCSLNIGCCSIVLCFGVDFADWHLSFVLPLCWCSQSFVWCDSYLSCTWIFCKVSEYYVIDSQKQNIFFSIKIWNSPLFVSDETKFTWNKEKTHNHCFVFSSLLPAGNGHDYLCVKLLQPQHLFPFRSSISCSRFAAGVLQLDSLQPLLELINCTTWERLLSMEWMSRVKILSVLSTAACAERCPTHITISTYCYLTQPERHSELQWEWRSNSPYKTSQHLLRRLLSLLNSLLELSLCFSQKKRKWAIMNNLNCGSPFLLWTQMPWHAASKQSWPSG